MPENIIPERFPEHFPPGCPPEESESSLIEVYRMTAESMEITARSFLETRLERPALFLAQQSNCLMYGISVFSDYQVFMQKPLSGAMKRLFEQKPYILKVTLEMGCTKLLEDLIT